MRNNSKVILLLLLLLYGCFGKKKTVTYCLVNQSSYRKIIHLNLKKDNDDFYDGYVPYLNFTDICNFLISETFNDSLKITVREGFSGESIDTTIFIDNYDTTRVLISYNERNDTIDDFKIVEDDIIFFKKNIISEPILSIKIFPPPSEVSLD